MIDSILPYLALAVAVAGIIASWAIVQHKQEQQDVTNDRTAEDLQAVKDRVNQLEKNEGIADAKRQDMVRMLQENSSDVKVILQKIAELATMLSMNNSRKPNQPE